MVCLFCESDQTYRRLARRAGVTDCVLITRWEAAYTYAPEATLFIVVRKWLQREDARRLRALRHFAPDLRIVVATARDADNCRLLVGTGVDDVVWEQDLPKSFEGLRSPDATAFLKRLARRVDDEVDIDVRLRRALHHLLTQPPPVPSVTELASVAGCSKTTLWRAASRATGAHSGRMLETAARWTLVLHAVALKRSGRPWPVIAKRVGVHVDTLSRTATNLTGCTLSTLAARGLKPLVQDFESTVLRSMTDSDPSPRGGLSVPSRHLNAPSTRQLKQATGELQ